MPSHFETMDVQNPCNWHAIKVHTRSEPVAAIALRNKGYEPFAPTIEERRRYSDRMATVQIPIFPGYVFCRFDARRKLPIISCPAVEYIVNFGGVPAIVPEHEIEGVRRLVERGARPETYLSIGQRVRVEYGALAGVEGILERRGKEHRLVVSVHLLQRSVSLEIDEALVRGIQPVTQKNPNGDYRPQTQDGEFSSLRR